MTSNKSRDVSITWYRVAYSLFVLLSIYYVFVNKDISSAVANFGIALIFDPFDQKVTWAERALWKRVWLIVHVSILMIGFIMMISGYTW